MTKREREAAMARARAKRRRKKAEPPPAEGVVEKVTEVTAETVQALGEVVMSAADAITETVAPETAQPPSPRRPAGRNRELYYAVTDELTPEGVR